MIQPFQMYCWSPKEQFSHVCTSFIHKPGEGAKVAGCPSWHFKQGHFCWPTRKREARKKGKLGFEISCLFSISFCVQVDFVPPYCKKPEVEWKLKINDNNVIHFLYIFAGMMSVIFRILFSPSSIFLNPIKSGRHPTKWQALLVIATAQISHQ